MTKPEPPTIEALTAAAEQLREAEKRHDDAKREASDASRRETSALNALNEAQKEFERIIAGFKGDAPHGSDWDRRECENVRRPANV